MYAAKALGDIGDQRAVDPLIQALQDEDSYIREAAAEALGDIGDTRAIDPLIEFLKDDDSGVRTEAAISLVKLGRTEYFDLIIQALQDYDSLVRLRAASELGDIGRSACSRSTYHCTPKLVSGYSKRCCLCSWRNRRCEGYRRTSLRIPE